MSLLYPKLKTKLLKADFDFDTASLVAYAVDLADYTYAANHEFLSDVPAAARVANVALANVTVGVVGDGVVDCDDFSFTAVTGDAFEAIVIVNDTGVEGTSELVALIDNGGSLSVTPDGGNINVTVAAGGLFTL